MENKEKLQKYIIYWEREIYAKDIEEAEEIGDYCPTLNEDYLQMEIIGNINKNPELLNPLTR